MIKSGVKPTPLTHPYTGVTKTRAEWAETLGISLGALHQRLHRDRLGTSKRKWWQGQIAPGLRLSVALQQRREYEHRLDGFRCWLEWFTPDEDVLRGETREVTIRVCGNSSECSQTMTYKRFSEEFRLIGLSKTRVRTLSPAALSLRAELANRSLRPKFNH